MKLKHSANVWQEEDIEPDESISVDKNKEKLSNGKPVINDENDKCVTKHANNKNISVQTKKKKKQEIDVKQKNESPNLENKRSPAKSEWDKPLEEGEIEYFIPSKRVRLEQANRTQKSKADEDNLVVKTNTSTPISVKIDIEVSSSSKLNGATPVQPLSTSAVSINCTPSTIERKKLPKPTMTSTEKKVKIVLKMNTSQEATEYIRQLKQSPQLPFDSTKKPLKGVLKPNLMPSPINPFYRKMLGL